jgi:putative transposase
LDNHPYGESDGQKIFSGSRMKRGVYLSGRKLLVNADLNGAANILKKAFLRLTKETTFNIETVNVWNPQTKII